MCHWKTDFWFSNYKAHHNHRFNKAFHYTARYWKKDLPMSNAIWFRHKPMKLKSPHHLAIHFQSSLNIHGHKIFPIRHTSQKRLQGPVLSDYSLYLKLISLRYLPTRQWYHKTSIDPVKMQYNGHLSTQREIHKSIFNPLSTLSHS